MVLLVLVAGSYFWHQRAVKSLSANFLNRADAKASSEDYVAAAQEVWRYLKIWPNDAEASAKLANYHFKSIEINPTKREIERSIELHNAALGLLDQESSKMLPLRIRLVELLTSVGRFGEAASAGAALINEQGEYGQKAKLLVANSSYAALVTSGGRYNSNELPSIGTLFEDAIQANPSDQQLVFNFANVFRTYPKALSQSQQEKFNSDVLRHSRADQLMNDLVSNYPNALNHLTRFEYKRRFDLDGQLEDLQVAKQLDPNNEQTLQQIANFLLQRAESDNSEQDPAILFKDAESTIKDALKLNPESAVSHELLGDILVKDDSQFDEAVDAWDKGYQLAEGMQKFSIGLKLAEAKIKQKGFERADSVLAELENMIGEVRGSRSNTRQLVSIRQSIKLLCGISQANQGRFLEARSNLRQVIDSNLENSELLVSAWLALGECYVEARLFDLAGECFSRASLERPSNPTYWSMAARAWINAKQFGQAVPYYEKLATFRPSSESWLDLASALYVSESFKPVNRRDRSLLVNALGNAEKFRDTANENIRWKLDLYQVILEFDGQKNLDPELVDRTLSALLDKAPENSIAIQDLVLAYKLYSQEASVVDFKEKVQSKISDKKLLEKLEANLLMSSGRAQEAVDLLDTQFENAADSEKPFIKIQRVDASLSQDGDFEKAIGELADFWKQEKKHFVVLQRIVELAILSGSLEEEESEWEKDLREIEGGNGHWTLYFEAKRLLSRTANIDQDVERNRLLDSASIVQQRLAKVRPLWPPTHTLAGEIASQFPKQRAIAIEHFERAIELGEKRPTHILKLVLLLYQNKQFVEAENYLPMIGELDKSKIGFALTHDILMNLKQLDRAERLARTMVAQNQTNDMVPTVGLGQILMAKGELVEAEQCFKKVIEQDDNLVDVALMSLFNLYIQKNETAKAKSVLDQLMALSEKKLPAGQRYFAKAQALELLKDPSAGEWYDKAAEKDPGNSRIWSRSAVYFVKRGDIDKAITSARRARNLPGNDNAENRALLVTLLAERGNDSDWEEIEKLKYSFQGADSERSSLDRLYAVLYTLKKSTTNAEKRLNLENSLRLLTEIKEDVITGSAANHLTLARVYQKLSEIESNSDKKEDLGKLAFTHYERASQTTGVTNNQLRVVAKYYIDNEKFELAKQLIQMVAEKDKENIGDESFATFALRLFYAGKTNQNNKIDALVGKFVGNRREKVTKEKTLDLYAAIGRICLQAELYEAAEKWLGYADTEEFAVFRQLTLAKLRLGKIQEALEFCCNRYVFEIEKPEDNKNNLIVISLVSGVLTSQGAQKKHFEFAEPVVKSSLIKNADSAVVLNAIASIRLLQGKRKASVELYRKAVELRPTNAVYLNNLATALAADPDSADEAMRVIERAIISYGRPTSQFLDTKASILVHKDLARAESIWREINHDKADPRITFPVSGRFVPAK